MSDADLETIETPLGKIRPDRGGQPVGVVRMDPLRSYIGVGELLKQYLDGAGEEPWHEISSRIDYTYEKLDLALGPLNAETGFGETVAQRLSRGQKLLFKPNLVMPLCIDPQTHAPASGSYTCTEWPFVAALMRWFHDRLDVRYHQMSLGEAATATTAAAGNLSLLAPGSARVTTEAVMEGRSAELYGGWGFYFARKYLAESGSRDADDDPMNGFRESVEGIYLPPGRAGNRLMVYDLNRIAADPSRGRVVPVSDGANFRSITLHKAVVGGDPADAADRVDYPGCILVNVPKLKVHAIALFTNIIKNLGIGLYPMHSTDGSSPAWQYAAPDGPVTGMKARIPHAVWTAEIDPRTCLPRRDAEGNPVVRKTAGMPGTMVDIIKAVVEQDIFAIHVSDGIEARNLDHQGVIREPQVKVAEGIAVAGLDPVAADLLCARYVFSNVGIEEAEKAGLGDGNGGRFPQRVPVPTVEGPNIVTHQGYDCPLARDITFGYAEQRGIGSREYHVVGADAVTGSRLVSVQGHLGLVRDGAFQDLVTDTVYFDAFKMPWDLQRTCLSYLEAVDRLTGSRMKDELLAAYDETGAGAFGYEQSGRQGAWDATLHIAADLVACTGSEKHGALQGYFKLSAQMLKLSSAAYNAAGDELFKESFRDGVLVVAKLMSELGLEMPDPFMPSLTFGKGKWPSYQTAAFSRLGATLFGNGYPFKAVFPSMYGMALYHADLTQNGGHYAGPLIHEPDPEGVQRYIDEVVGGRTGALDFVFHVPPGFGNLAGVALPNVQESTDSALVFTASFAGGKEVWPVPAAG